MTLLLQWLCHFRGSLSLGLPPPPPGVQSRAEADLEYALWNCKADAANNRRKILKFLARLFCALHFIARFNSCRWRPYCALEFQQLVGPVRPQAIILKQLVRILRP